LLRSKRNIVRVNEDPISYNSMFICVDELGAFIHKYDNEMVSGLSALYDPDPYSQERRTNELKVKIHSPQINLLCGVTPQDLIGLMPDKAWGQGFSSRLIMIFSDERIIGDDFATKPSAISRDLEHDLALINDLYGQFEVTQDYRDAVNHWRQIGEPPVPNHPKLIHYVTRRHTHIYKLSMVSAIDRGNALVLMKEDFDRAINWLLNAEAQMPEIFKAGATNADGQAMDEIYHYVMMNDRGDGVSEQKIIYFARERVPINSILRIVEIMQKSGLIRAVAIEKRTGLRSFKAVREARPTIN
jgi:Protein of unknown function (DUF3987)